MTRRHDDRRRALVRALGAAAVAAIASPVLAQDPRSALVQSAARDWLALTDRVDGAASWKAAGARFRNAIPADDWTKALKQVREPLGALATRAVDSTRFEKSFPGLPDGDYAIIVFRTSFANKASARETITLEREEGAWRVVGYLIA
jgi:hypothetical protein